MTIEEILLKPVKASRVWKHGEKFLKFRRMHQRYKKGRLGKIELAIVGRRYR